MRSILCSGTIAIYEYKGYRFEFHETIGPWPVNAVGDPVDHPKHEFFEVATDWANLKNREDYMVLQKNTPARARVKPQRQGEIRQ